MYFYIMPRSNMKEIKKDAYRDMGEKLKLWKHKLKKKLNIQKGDTPDTVRPERERLFKGMTPRI
jgi:hypothetical protein